MDEMSSPTTASPAGLLCMTAVCVFTGRGLVGQILVSTAAFIHLGLAIWFIYMALAYNILPEPRFVSSYHRRHHHPRHLHHYHVSISASYLQYFFHS